VSSGKLKKWINNQCYTVEVDLRRNNTKEAYAAIKNLTRRHQPRSTVINDKNGRTITERKAVAERWQEYCHDLYGNPSSADISVIKTIQGDREQEEKLPILREEVEAAVGKLKNGKAEGIDYIPGELQSKGGEETIAIILQICNKVWLLGKWPQSWTSFIVVLIPKKGNLKGCQNYRTICLISDPSKVLLRVILNRLKPQIEPSLAEEQAGLRSGRGTVAQILNLKLLCEKYTDH